ncbi:glycosyltransferase family 4 protein [Synoicihabitans lomoniglobus]|uniref:Glycosyltransferase family 4 protein n=1 Tax=Synoicihabitans lomoniglobus TaxID=2909285 RepID=A0AAF0CSP6_9BACT|nr:glycosyltransferase family 4 protein [Opitutaceae bacterium LMO-M01]WED67323.1 glycosyltransferase family 4 protein [Opitutaceae bacterium LMO-M01]
MRTLLLAPAVFASEGGIERMMRLYLKALCEIADAEGGEVGLAALNDTPPTSSQPKDYASKSLVKQLAGRGKRLSFSLRFLLLAHRFDLIICGHVNLLPLAAICQKLAPSLRVALVAHGIELWKPWSKSRSKMARRISILAVSEHTRQRVQSACPTLTDQQMHVLPNCLDPLRPETSLPATQTGSIVALTRLSHADRYKGVDQLIEALPLIQKNIPAARLRVIGQGDDRARLEELANRVAPGAVEFTGFLPDDELAHHLGSAQLFALPSRDEGFGLVYLEALALGVPCVAANAGAAPELVVPEVGELAGWGDREALATACCRVMQQNWSRAALQTYSKHFSFEIFRDRLKPLLASI